MKSRWRLSLLLLPFFLANSHWGFAAGVDLHAHLFMKSAMTWVFRGSFNDPLQARDWTSRFSSQANPQALDASGLDVVVATLYGHPLFQWSMRDAVREQIQTARRFVAENPHWMIARSPAEAEKGLQEGKKILILALEGASGILDTEEDLKEFVDEGGIRIVTLLHLTDDHLGGVAFPRGIAAWSSPFAFLKNLINPHRGEMGVRTNVRGLSFEGMKLVQALVQRRVWIDLAHASDQSQTEIIPLLKAAGQPLLYTHMVLRKFHGAERALSQSQVERIIAYGAYGAHGGGMVGIMPSAQMLEGTNPSRCEGGIHDFATQYGELMKQLGKDSIAIGSDFNGGIPHLRPTCDAAATGTSLDQEGLWNIGQSQDLWRGLEKVLGRAPGELSQASTRGFLSRWKKLWPSE